jgi:hypothetical protein
MSDANKHTELQTIKQIAANNGYSTKIIDTLFKKKQTQVATREIYRGKTQGVGDLPKWRRLPFLGGISLRIQRLLPRNKIKAAFYNRRTLKHLLGSLKDKIDIFEQSGVYELRCNDCNAIYIGQTGRTFNIRTKEHLACFTNKKNNSQFAKHLLTHEHHSDFIPKILHIEKKGRRLDALEELEINTNTRNNDTSLVNEILYPSRSPLLCIPFPDQAAISPPP